MKQATRSTPVRYTDVPRARQHCGTIDGVVSCGCSRPTVRLCMAPFDVSPVHITFVAYAAHAQVDPVVIDTVSQVYNVGIKLRSVRTLYMLHRLT